MSQEWPKHVKIEYAPKLEKIPWKIVIANIQYREPKKKWFCYKVPMNDGKTFKLAPIVTLYSVRKYGIGILWRQMVRSAEHLYQWEEGHAPRS